MGFLMMERRSFFGRCFNKGRGHDEMEYICGVREVVIVRLIGDSLFSQGFFLGFFFFQPIKVL